MDIDQELAEARQEVWGARSAANSAASSAAHSAFWAARSAAHSAVESSAAWAANSVYWAEENHQEELNQQINLILEVLC